MSRDAQIALKQRVFCHCVCCLCVIFCFLGMSGVFAAAPGRTVNQGKLNVQRPPSFSNGGVAMSRISLNATPAYRFETANFVIENAPSEEMAREFGTTAEICRRELAVLWIGQELPNWPDKCPIHVKVGKFNASGDTTFTFDRGKVYGWKMNVRGTRERINDSVLPHEISHTIFATYFRRPLPRWLDEGAATNVEHISERMNYRRMLLDFVDPNVRRAIPFNRMVEMKDYPDDYLPLYSQCNSVAEFLIAQGGHRRYVEFAKDGLENNDWNTAVRKNYGYDNLGDLQVVWIHWVARDFPPISEYEPALARNRKVQSDSLYAATQSSPVTLTAWEATPQRSDSHSVASRETGVETGAKDSSYPPQMDVPRWQSPHPKIAAQVSSGSSQRVPQYSMLEFRAPDERSPQYRDFSNDSKNPSRYGSGKTEFYEPATVGLRR